MNLTRFHGVFAPNSRLRQQVTPARSGKRKPNDAKTPPASAFHPPGMSFKISIRWRLLGRVTEMVPVTQTVRTYRDPRDDKFLELAVSGDATVVVTGDRDLLALDPFRGIPIIAPAAYLAR